MLPSVLLVGFGRMGAAMAAGWREEGLAPSFAVDPSLPVSPGPELAVMAGPDGLPAGFAPAALVVAVKPQFAAAALPAYRRHAAGAVVLSIMAGWRIERLAGTLGPAARVVRAMPNTPAAVRQGITVACAGPGVSPGQRDLCDRLLRAIGTVAWVADEALIDPVTAISGGGPAYVFLLAELLEQAARAHGIAPDLARLLARQTVSGSGALLAASPEDAAELRRAVTSPKGTTERALAVLMAEGAWPACVAAAVDAATARARELSNLP